MDAPTDPYEARLNVATGGLTSTCRHCATLIRWWAGIGWRHAIVGLDARHAGEPLPLELERSDPFAGEVTHRGVVDSWAHVYDGDGGPCEHRRYPTSLPCAQGPSGPAHATGLDTPAGAGDDVEAFRG